MITILYYNYAFVLLMYIEDVISETFKQHFILQGCHMFCLVFFWRRLCSYFYSPLNYILAISILVNHKCPQFNAMLFIYFNPAGWYKNT